MPSPIRLDQLTQIVDIFRVQIVEENKRQLCVFSVANETGKPWLWWDFVGTYGTRCSMANGKFNNAECAKAEVEAIGLDNDKILECMGDSQADREHPLLQVAYSTYKISGRYKPKFIAYLSLITCASCGIWTRQIPCFGSLIHWLLIVGSYTLLQKQSAWLYIAMVQISVYKDIVLMLSLWHIQETSVLRGFHHGWLLIWVTDQT